MCVCVCVCVCVYIYIYRERERERERDGSILVFSTQETFVDNNSRRVLSTNMDK